MHNPPLDTDDKVEFRLGGNIVVTSSLSDTAKANFLPLPFQVLFHVCIRTLENNLALGKAVLRGSNSASVHIQNTKASGKRKKKKKTVPKNGKIKSTIPLTYPLSKNRMHHSKQPHRG